MDFERLQHVILEFVQNSKENYISQEDAIRPDLAGMKIFDAPIFGVAAANDPLFEQLRRPEVVGPDVFLPSDWVKEAKSVLSFFLPFTEKIKRSNCLQKDIASDEWLHARIEGQHMLDMVGKFICDEFIKCGFTAVYPAADKNFHMIAPLVSNWSERHIAYICGLGTFGLSKGLITKKGMAGRFGSIVTSAPLPITYREYSTPFEYCILCGKCQRNCPVQAIDIKKGIIDGKDHVVCAGFVKASELPPHGPNQIIRYGCGKCQVNVPCESGIPKPIKQK